jgi:DNA-directed RNA polymerase subunit N (RpoN/RPB10)
MIIPVRCVTCGSVLANKYEFYQKEVRRIKLSRGVANIDQVVYFTTKNSDLTPEGEVLNQLGIRNVCCRRHMLTHVDIE